MAAQKQTSKKEIIFLNWINLARPDALNKKHPFIFAQKQELPKKYIFYYCRAEIFLCFYQRIEIS